EGTQVMGRQADAAAITAAHHYPPGLAPVPGQVALGGQRQVNDQFLHVAPEGALVGRCWQDRPVHAWPPQSWGSRSDRCCAARPANPASDVLAPRSAPASQPTAAR